MRERNPREGLDEMTEEIYEKECEVCGRKFHSLWLRQVEENLKSHMQTHRKRRK